MALHRPLERIQIPQAFRELITSRATYKTYHGGRGAAKSRSFGGALVYMMPRLQIRALCCREIQASIADSVHKLLVDAIHFHGYEPYFKITDNRITCPATGSEAIFKGLRHNVQGVRSTEGINIAWVEEAQYISDTSWEALIPTVLRTPGAQIWNSMNPDDPEGATQKRFIDAQPENSICRKVSWRDNPFFPDELDAARRYLERVDPDAYQHVWEGGCRTHSDAQILKGKYVVEPFIPGADWTEPLYGADWGFSQDPSTLVKCWIYGNKLYVEHEAWALGCETLDLPRLFNTVPGAKTATIFADNSRPETISQMKRVGGYPGIFPAEKWAGSVEDGITFLRQFEQIVIHPRCVHTAAEARMYRYKIDDKKGKEAKITTTIVDADNHCIDAIRYALHQKIRTRGMGIFDYYREEAEKAAAERNGLNGNVPGN